MCSGGAERREKVRRENAEKAAKREAERRQAELDRLARERTVIAAQQQASLAAMQKQQEAQIAVQKQEAASLQAQQRDRLSAIREDRDLKVATANAQGQAVSSSLRILAGGGAPQAPTAQQSSRSLQTRGAKNTAASLRMGSSSRGRGAGANLSI